MAFYNYITFKTGIYLYLLNKIVNIKGVKGTFFAPRLSLFILVTRRLPPFLTYFVFNTFNTSYITNIILKVLYKDILVPKGI